jgi:UrcA family protein
MNFVVLLSSLAAFHAEPAPPHAMVVNLRGLDLHSVSGSAIAVQRINDAARAFCALRSAPHDVDLTILKCRRELSQLAVERTHSREVKTVYLESPSGMVFADAG